MTKEAIQLVSYAPEGVKSKDTVLRVFVAFDLTEDFPDDIKAQFFLEEEFTDNIHEKLMSIHKIGAKTLFKIPSFTIFHKELLEILKKDMEEYIKSRIISKKNEPIQTKAKD